MFNDVDSTFLFFSGVNGKIWVNLFVWSPYCSISHDQIVFNKLFGNDVDAAWRRPVRLFTKFVNQKIFWFPHANSSGLFPFCVGKYDKYCLLVPWTLLYKANRDSSSSSFIILSKYRKIMQVKIRPKIATHRKEFNKLWVKLFVRSN